MLRGFTFIIVGSLFLCPVAIGQVVSPAEAQAKLNEKAAARAAERAKTTTITVGELEDLRAQVDSLKAQIAALQKKLADFNATATAPPKRRFTAIEVGMTKDELLLFVKARPHEYAVKGFHLGTHDTNVRTEQVKTLQRTQTDTAAAPAVRVSETQVERTTDQGKHETLDLDILSPRTVTTGHQKDMFGGDHPVNETQYVATGRLHVQLTNDVVSSIDGRG